MHNYIEERISKPRASGDDPPVLCPEPKCSGVNPARAGMILTRAGITPHGVT